MDLESLLSLLLWGWAMSLSVWVDRMPEGAGVQHRGPQVGDVIGWSFDLECSRLLGGRS